MLRTVWRCGGIVAALAAATTSQAQTNVDWQEVAEQLVARRAATDEGTVDYRYYGCRLTQEAYGSLVALLGTGQQGGNPAIVSEVDAWLADNLPGEREVMRGWTSFDGSLWQDCKQRTAQDTLAQATAARALTASAVAAKLSQRVTTHSDGVTETIITDLRTVELKHAPADVHPLSPLDMSLLPWQQMLDQGPGMGQEIAAVAEGAVHTITVLNTDTGDGDAASASYTFDESRVFAPLRGALLVGTTLQMELQFAYGEQADGAPVRPAVACKGVRAADGLWEVTLWVVESWTEWGDAEWLLLKKPPVHLEVDHRLGLDPPVASNRWPSYLEGVSSEEERVRLALQRVLGSWGTSDPEADYNCDGIVDDADTKAATDVLVVVSREH